MKEDKNLKFPFEIHQLEPELNDELLKYFHGEKNGYVKVNSYLFPRKYETEAEKYYHFQARPDDVWIVSTPRSGTTWSQELVWLIANDLDFETALQWKLTERFPFFEIACFLHPEIKAQLLKENEQSTENCKFIEQICTPGYELLERIPPTKRRFIKTHFPFSLLPPSVMKQKCKVIYVTRNPIDIAVSYYHLHRIFRSLDYKGDFARFWHYFECGLLPWLPYRAHLYEALLHTHLPNVLLLHYEDMKKDLRSIIKKIADFLNCKIQPAGVENLMSHLSITNFRNNTSVNMDEMRKIGLLNKREAGFVRIGGESVPKEFADNAPLYKRAKEWIKNQEKYLYTHIK